MGCVVDLRDFGLRTPEQVLRVFYRMFDAGAIESGLWNAYATIAIARETDTSGRNVDVEEMALLFDQLIALTKAVEALIKEPPERCPVCKRVEAFNGEAG